MNERTQSVVSRLTDKIEDWVEQFSSMKAENEKLISESVSLKAQNEAKDIVIAKLEEEISGKEAELEELVNKVDQLISME